MNQNMALLSQTEIDTLLDFLQKSKVGEEVMDQASIDRLINLLSSDQKREVKFNTNMPHIRGREEHAILAIDALGGIQEQQRCVLECQVDGETKYLRIICRDEKKDAEYEITPTCVSELRYYSGDSSRWGYAIPPVTFDHIAALMSVKYTKSVFDKICHIFAKHMYGNEEITIPELYMPTTYDLIRHLKE